MDLPLPIRVPYVTWQGNLTIPRPTDHMGFIVQRQNRFQGRTEIIPKNSVSISVAGNFTPPMAYARANVLLLWFDPDSFLSP